MVLAACDESTLPAQDQGSRTYCLIMLNVDDRSNANFICSQHFCFNSAVCSAFNFVYSVYFITLL